MTTQTDPFRFTEDDLLRFDRLNINANSLLEQGYDPEIIYQYSDEIEEESQPTTYEAPSLTPSYEAPSPPIYEAPQIETQVQQEAPVMGDVTPDTKLSDLGSLFMGSFNKVLSYPGFIVEKIGEQSGNSNITELGKMLKSGADENARSYFSSLSDQMKRDLEMDFFTYADPESIIPTGTAKGFFNLNKWLGTVAQGAGSTAIPLGTGAVATNVLGRTLLKGMPGLAGALGFGGAGATIEGVGSARDVHDTILETDLETVYNSPMFDAFSQKIKPNYPDAQPEQIAMYTRQMIANHASVDAGKVSGAIIGATSVPFGTLLGRLGIGGAGAARQGFGKAFFKGLTYEGTQEFVQEFSQQIVSNYGVYVSGVPISPTKGAFESGFGGFAAGGPIGSTTAGIASVLQKEQPDVTPPDDGATPEERLTAFAQKVKQEEEAKGQQTLVTPATVAPAIPVLQPDVPVRQDVTDILQEGGSELTTGSRRTGGRVSPTEELKWIAQEADKISRLTREEITEEDIAELNMLRNSLGLPTFTLDQIKATLDSTEIATTPPSDALPTTVGAVTPEPDDETNRYFPGLDLETGEDVTDEVADEVNDGGYQYEYDNLDGIFWRGEGIGGTGVGGGMLGKGFYLGQNKEYAEWYQKQHGKSGELNRYKVKPGLKILSYLSSEVRSINNAFEEKYNVSMVPPPVNDPRYVDFLTKEVKALGYDGVFSSHPREGLVIFDKKNVERVVASTGKAIESVEKVHPEGWDRYEELISKDFYKKTRDLKTKRIVANIEEEIENDPELSRIRKYISVEKEPSVRKDLKEILDIHTRMLRANIQLKPVTAKELKDYINGNIEATPELVERIRETNLNDVDAKDFTKKELGAILDKMHDDTKVFDKAEETDTTPPIDLGRSVSSEGVVRIHDSRAYGMPDHYMPYTKEEKEAKGFDKSDENWGTKGALKEEYPFWNHPENKEKNIEKLFDKFVEADGKDRYAVKAEIDKALGRKSESYDEARTRLNLPPDTEEVAPKEKEISPEAEKIFERLEEERLTDYETFSQSSITVEEYKDGRFSVSGLEPKFLIKNFSKEQADNFVAKLRDNPGETLRVIQGYARLAKVPVENKETVTAVEKKVENIKKEDKAEDLKTAKELSEALRANAVIASNAKSIGKAKTSLKEVQRLSKKLGNSSLPTEFLLEKAREQLKEVEQVPFAQRDFKKVAFYKSHIQALEDILNNVLRYKDAKAVKQVATILKRQLKDMKETGYEVERGVDLSGNVGNLVRILEFTKMHVKAPVTKENPEGVVTLSGAELLRSLNVVSSMKKTTIPKGTQVTKLDTGEIRRRVKTFDNANSALHRRWNEAIEKNDQYVKSGKDKDGKPFTDEDGIKAIQDIDRTSIAEQNQLIEDYINDGKEMGFNALEFFPTVEEQSSENKLEKARRRIATALDKFTTAAGGVETVFDKKQRSKKARQEAVEKEVLYQMPERLLSGEVIIHQYHPTKAGETIVRPGWLGPLKKKVLPAQKGIKKPKGVPVTSYTATRKSLPQPPLLDEAFWRSYMGSAFDNKMYESYRKGKVSKATLSLWENARIDGRVLELSPDITVVTSSDLETTKAMNAASERIKKIQETDVNKYDLMERTGKEGQAARQEYYGMEAQRQADTGEIPINPSTGRPYNSVEEQEWVEKSKPTVTRVKQPKKKKVAKVRLKLRDAALLFSRRKVKDGEEGSSNANNTYNTGRNNVAYHHEKDGKDDIIRMVFKDGSDHGRPIAYLHIEKGVLTKTTKVASALKDLEISNDALNTNIGIVMGIVIEQRSRNAGKNLFDEVTQLDGFIPKQKAEVDRFRTMLIEGEISKAIVEKTMEDRPMFQEMKRKIDELKEHEKLTGMHYANLPADRIEAAHQTVLQSQKEHSDKVVEKAMEGVYEIVGAKSTEETKLAPKKKALSETTEVQSKGKQILGTDKSGAEQQANMETESGKESGLTDETLRCD